MKTLLYRFNTQYSSLALSMGFALLLLLFRIHLTHSLFYIFLVWNLFLAAIPYLITQGLRRNTTLRSSAFLSLLCFGFWLLFLPNSPYIITDLVHLHNNNSHLVWYDLFLVFVFALNGLVLGLLSMMDMYELLANRFSEKVALFTMFKICMLAGYGIYLGRFLRFNSWDIVARPKTIFLEMVNTVYDPKVWLMTFAFGGFLWIIFLLLKSLIQSSNNSFC